MVCSGCGCPTFIAHHYSTDAPVLLDALPVAAFEVFNADTEPLDGACCRPVDARYVEHRCRATMGA